MVGVVATAIHDAIVTELLQLPMIPARIKKAK
jgi:CO/xanthine dehydrogenase Mo-binding subunit